MLKVGVDIVAISRIESFFCKYGKKGLAKFLTQNEINLAKSPQTYAGFWAAKEACSKALQCGISKELSFNDMEITKTTKNAPILSLSEKKRAYFKVDSISLSISHDNGFAIAVVAITFL